MNILILLLYFKIMSNMCCAIIWSKGTLPRCTNPKKYGDFCGKHGIKSKKKGKCKDCNVIHNLV